MEGQPCAAHPEAHCYVHDTPRRRAIGAGEESQAWQVAGETGLPRHGGEQQSRLRLVTLARADQQPTRQPLFVANSNPTTTAAARPQSKSQCLNGTDSWQPLVEVPIAWRSMRSLFLRDYRTRNPSACVMFPSFAYWLRHMLWNYPRKPTLSRTTHLHWHCSHYFRDCHNLALYFTVRSARLQQGMKKSFYVSLKNY